MFQEIEGMIQKAASGEIDQQTVSQGADQHVNSMDSNELAQHVQIAANNAQQSGNGGLAQQLVNLVETQRSNPDALKSGIISLISNNPQILAHFAPSFAQGILNPTRSG
ncbi:MAG: hypothetical protein JOZ77_08280 [Candidatus Eremiobacteraeota bacterium]|nr:hypothetical protein [Candidatus Eremiobacteraeota bacterium]